MVTTPAAATSRHFTAGAAAGVAANWQDPSSGYDGGYSSSNEQEGSQGGDLVEWPKAEVEFGLQSGDCSSSRDSGSRHSSRSNKSSSAASSTSTRKASNATTPAVAARSAAASSSAYGVAGAAPQAAIPLFGRDAELRELERQCETMRVVAMYGTDDHNHRPPSVVLLRGPSGCGKTALAHELGRRVQLRAAAAEAPAATAGDPATPREQAFSEAPPQSGEEDHDREPGGSQGRKKNVVFVSGKVDQFQRHLPFTVILRSLAELGNHLLVLMARKRKMRGATAIEIPSDADLRAIRSVLRHEGRTLVQMVPSLTEFMEGNQYQLPDDSSLSSASSSSFNGRGQRVGTFDNGLGSEELSLLQQSEKMSHRSLGVNNPAKSNEVVTERLVCLAVQSFLRAFVKRIDPVVWFVDDLHWADDSSLRLLQALVTDPHLANVLFLMGYRPSEEDGRSESSSLPRASVELDRLWRCCTPRRIDVELGNLPIAAQVPWLAHMLNCDMTRARPLAELVHRKTDGNPYFVLNFLELLQRRQQLRYRYQSQKWDWNMGEILEAESPSPSGGASGGGSSSLSRHQQHSRQNSGTATTMTMHSLEEVVKMQIVSLPLLVQQLLQVASCLGFYFDEGLLRGLLQTCDSLLLMGFSQVTALANLAYEDDDAGSAFTNPQSEDNEEANEAYLEALYKAEEEGLIRSTRDPKIYQFSHDRVQQIVYQSMASTKEVALLHLRIGKYIQEQEDESYILDAADQLNRGSLLLVHEMERLELIELNLEVSAHANKRGGVNLMSSYLEKAVSLVKDHDWVKSYDLVLEVFNRSAEAEATRGRFDKCMERVAAVLQHAKRSHDTVRARFVRIHALGYQGNAQQAVRESRRLLTELGERLPPSNAVTCLFEFKRTHRLVQDMDLSASELEGLAPIADDKKIWAAKVLKAAALFASSFDPTFSSLASLRLMGHTLEHGSCDATPFAFASYGAVLAEKGLMDDASRFGDLALRFGNLSACLVVHSNLYHLKHPFRHGLKPLLSAYRMGLEIGNVHFGGLAVAEYAKLYVVCGHPLGPFAETLRNLASQLQLCGLGMALAYVLPTLQFALNLRGESKQSALISLETCKDELSSSLETSIDVTDSSALYMHYLQAFNSYVAGDLQLAESALQKASCAKIQGTHFLNVFHSFIDALVAVAVYRQSGQRKHLAAASKVTKRIAALAEKHPRNCSGMHSLMQALLESESSRPIDKLSVAKLYDRAIENFRKGGFFHFAAIASERASEFMSRHVDSRRSERYLESAVEFYREWGATVKVKALQKGKEGCTIGPQGKASKINNKRFSNFRTSMERSRGFLSERFDT